MSTANQAERSVLVTPASSRPMVEKAVTSPADVALLDLEDAVAPDQKAAARAEVIRALRDLDWGVKPRSYRVNALDTPFFYRDLIDVVEAAGDRVDRIVVPKVDRPEDVYVVATLLGQIEAGQGLDRQIGLEVQIETATGLANCDAIAAASHRVEAIVFGPGDYAASVRIPAAAIGSPDEWDAVYGGQRFHYPMHRILVAGRAAELRVVDGPFADFRHEEGFRRSCRVARALGFDGKWCIHPAQIAIANEIFSPSEAEVEWARRVVAAHEAAERDGRGAVAVDGRMIDAASIRMARVALEQDQQVRRSTTDDRP